MNKQNRLRALADSLSYSAYIKKKRQIHIARPALCCIGRAFLGAPNGRKDAAGSEYERRGYSIHVWQRYASPVWFDIRQTNVLNIQAARDDRDEKHICPLQLDVIERSVQLWSNPGDTIFSPFMGIGSEGYVAVKTGRKFVGIELKQSYFEQAVKNLDIAVAELNQGTLFGEVS